MCIDARGVKLPTDNPKVTFEYEQVYTAPMNIKTVKN